MASELEAHSGISVGDHVWIGGLRPGKVHWRVVGIHQAAPGKVYATLRSGMTERSRVAPIESLSLHTKADAA